MKLTGRLRPLHCSTTSPSSSIAPAGDQFAHLLADGYVSEGIAGFAFAMFVTRWAWINFSWLASSFATNVWLYRVMTMVPMVGVVVVALGLPAMFHSLPTGGHLDIRIMAAGYLVLRFAMVAQPGRAKLESRLDLISVPFGAGDDRGRRWRCEPCTPPNHIVFRWPIICGSSGLTSFEVRFFGR